MTRTASNRTKGPQFGPTFALAVTTAMAGVMLSGCAGKAAPPAAASAGQAQVALAKGQSSKAVQNAEAAVLAEPRNAAYRAMLGSAYLDAGRFASAATSFDDAMKLGDTSARTALSLALALAGSGKQAEAVAVLNDWKEDIAKADLGLAYSLAGYPERGIAVLSDAIRGGENSAKTRQNLAYSYALAGRWKEARLMAAEDVPADQVGTRIAEWAAQVDPRNYQGRVAGLLGVPAGAKDMGQPVALALNMNPPVEQLAVQAAAYAPEAYAPPPAPVAQVAAYEAPAPAPVAQRSMELPPIGDAPADPAVSVPAYQPAPAAPANFEDAFAAPAPAGGSLAAVTSDAMRFVQSAQVQTAPVRRGVTPAPAQLARAQKADGTHLVQLGSFASEQGARRAWGIYAKRYPELAGHQMVITEAMVKGKRYWRVSAAGFDRTSSRSMCGKVSGGIHGCIAWSKDRPLPGAVADTGVRLARR